MKHVENNRELRRVDADARHTVGIARRGFVKALGLAAAGLALPGGGVLRAMVRDHGAEVVRHSTFLMGQITNVTIVTSDAPHARRVVTLMFDELRRLEGLFSVYDPASQASAVNRSAGRSAVPAAPELVELLEHARSVARATRGALDITVEPLMRLWGFHGVHRKARPTDREVHRVLDAVGIDALAIEGDAVGLTRPGAAIDLGGVAVGYALDRAAAIARREGITSALIEMSGDFHAIGAPPGSERGWEIGIQDPVRRDALCATRHIRDAGLSTSGNYANTVVYHARKYGHILDPHRGLPAHRVHSATVIAPTATLADAYSTALFVAADRSILPAGCSGLLV